ncbi:MAG TPA: hypothetical protein VFN49_06980 [Candidatus Aquilonibacter sp.]|nr:hypothetical protein [Candidatus Aquilonibacter sp.]
MAILLWIVFGLIAGAIAKYIVGGGPSAVFGDIVVGIVGVECPPPGLDAE